MGYESTLIFGTYNAPTDEERDTPRFTEYGTFLQIISTLDLSKMGYDGPWATLLRESPPNTANLFLFLRDGDKEERVDPFGEPFKVLDAERLLMTLEKEATSGYRRAVLAVDVVTAWVKHSERFTGRIERPAILHYGH